MGFDSVFFPQFKVREDEDALLFIPKRKARECKAARRTRRVGMHCIYWQRGDALRDAVFHMYVQIKRADAVFVWKVQRERVAPPEEETRGGSCFVLQTSRSSSSTSSLSSLLPLNGCCLQGKGVTSSSICLTLTILSSATDNTSGNISSSAPGFKVATTQNLIDSQPQKFTNWQIIEADK